MRRTIIIFAIIILLSSSACAHKNTVLMPNHNFKTYKTAYIEILPQDEFNLGTEIIKELSDLGLDVNMKVAPTNPGPTDMLVKYSYDDGWDMAKYLKSFQVFFFDAKTTSLIASFSYHLEGNYAGTEARVQSAFDDFRKEAGLPPNNNRPKIETRIETFDPSRK